MERLKLSKVASLSLLIGLALVAVPVEAGTDDWSAVGQPNGGTVGKVLVDPTTPSTVYAVANHLIFKSTDSGATWASIFLDGSPNLMTGDIALDPLAHDTLYAVFGVFGGGSGQISGEGAVIGSDPGGIYKSTDGGGTWTQIDDGIGNDSQGDEDSLCRVAVDPVNEGVVYAGGCDTGMYKSTDGGASWDSIGPALGQADVMVNNIVVDPVTPSVLYVEVNAAAGNHLYKSTDSGQHWHVLGVTASGFDADVAIDPTDHTHIMFCGTDDGGVSTDSGATWTPSDCSGTYALGLAFDPSNPAHVLEAVNGLTPDTLAESTDGGATFNVNTSLPPNGVQSFGSIAFDPGTPGTVYLGTMDWGVLKSIDGGATWSPSSVGITAVHAGQMLEGSDGVIYMGTGNAGIYKSLDQGASWAQVGTGISGSLPYLADVTLSSLAQDPASPSTLYAGSWAGFDVSTDGGDTWNPSMTGMDSAARVEAMAIDPQAPATLYAGAEFGHSGGGRNCENGWCAELYKSVDGGATWASASDGLRLTYLTVDGITVDPQQSNVVYAAADYDGVYKSVDAGAHWSLSRSGEGNVQFYAVAVDPKDSDVVYASALQGFYKSTDGGATWMESDEGMTTLGTQINGIIQIDPDDTSTLYVSSKYGFGTAYVSSDAGATWFPLTAGASDSSMKSMARSARPMSRGTMSVSKAAQQVSLGAVMIDPRHHKRIYAGGSDGTVYTYDNLHPPTAAAATDTGGEATASSGGGGGFPVFGGLVLLLALIRRRSAR